MKKVHKLKYHYADGAFGDESYANIMIRYHGEMDQFAKYRLDCMVKSLIH